MPSWLGGRFIIGNNPRTRKTLRSPWRGSLLPLGCEAVVKPADAVYLDSCAVPIGAAAPPSGSKLPRHGGDQAREYRTIQASLFAHRFNLAATTTARQAT